MAADRRVNVRGVADDEKSGVAVRVDDAVMESETSHPRGVGYFAAARYPVVHHGSELVERWCRVGKLRIARRHDSGPALCHGEYGKESSPDDQVVTVYRKCKVFDYC